MSQNDKKNNLVATVDLGSNSFRLQICKNNNGNLQVVDSLKDMIHFAAGLDTNNNLNKSAQQIALKCLSRYGQRLKGFKKSHVRVVATNTFRVAKNIQSFIDDAEQALGFPIDIIAGREEARLIYSGVVHTQPLKEQETLIIDIGGGSTEFAIGKNLHPKLTESLNMGCVSFSVKFFKNDKIDEKSFKTAVSTAQNKIQQIKSNLIEKKWEKVIGTSGTAKALMDVIQFNFDQNQYIELSLLESLAQKIIVAKSVKQAKIKGLKENRESVFAGGLAIMIAVFKELNIKKMTICDSALRDGVLYDLIGRQLDKDLRDETVSDYQSRYHVDLSQAMLIHSLSLKILDSIHHKHRIKDFENWKNYISWASKLHEIGLSISHIGFHKHSAYILEHADMPGFSQKDQSTLSSILLGHRGNLKKILAINPSKELWYAIFSLRLASIFSRARNNEITFPKKIDIDLNLKEREIIILLSKKWLEKNPLIDYALKSDAEQWDKINVNFIIKSLS